MSNARMVKLATIAILGIFICLFVMKNGGLHLASITDNAHLRARGACAWGDERNPRRFVRLLVARADGAPVSEDLTPTSRRTEWSADHVARLAPSVSEPGRCMVAPDETVGAGIAGSAAGTPTMSPDGRFVYFFADVNAGDTIRPTDSDPPLRWIEPATTASNFLIWLGAIFACAITIGCLTFTVFFGKSVIGSIFNVPDSKIRKRVEIIAILMIIAALATFNLFTGYISEYPDAVRSDMFAVFDRTPFRSVTANFWVGLAVAGLTNIGNTLADR